MQFANVDGFEFQSCLKNSPYEPTKFKICCTGFHVSILPTASVCIMYLQELQSTGKADGGSGLRNTILYLAYKKQQVSICRRFLTACSVYSTTDCLLSQHSGILFNIVQLALHYQNVQDVMQLFQELIFFTGPYVPEFQQIIQMNDARFAISGINIVMSQHIHIPPICNQ